MENLRREIKAAIQGGRYTAESLAKEVGVSKAQIHNYLLEDGQSPRLNVFAKLCDALQIDASDVMGQKRQTPKSVLEALERVREYLAK